MSEPGEQQAGGEFARLAEFAQHSSVLPDPEQIRVLSLRRLRRRRAGQTVLGTGAVAAAVFLGANLGTTPPPTTTPGPTSSPGGSVVIPVAGSSAMPTKQFRFPQNVSESTGTAVVAELHHNDFASVRIENVASSTVPAGNAVEIDDAQHHSLLGKLVAVNTPLTVLVSAGPSSSR